MERSTGALGPEYGLKNEFERGCRGRPNWASTGTVISPSPQAAAMTNLARLPNRCKNWLFAAIVFDR